MWTIRELEATLYKHPGVWDVATVTENEDSLAVYVQPRAGVDLAAGELIKFCKQKGNSQVVNHLYIVNKLPKTKTGKISKGDLGQLKPTSVSNF